MRLEFRHFSTVILGGFAPLQVNSEYLYKNEIVPSDLSLKTNEVSEEDFSQIQYNNDIIITTETGKITIGSDIHPKKEDEITKQITEIAINYINCNPQKYTSIGLNPKIHYILDSIDNGKNILSQLFLRQYNWMNDKDIKSIIPNVKLMIEYGTRILNLSISLARFQKLVDIEPVILFEGNYHYNINEHSVKLSSDYARDIISNCHEIIKEFTDFIQHKLLGEFQ